MKLIALFLGASFVMISCKKNNNNSCPYTLLNATAPSAEVAALRDSLYAHNIHTFSSDPSGLFYEIINPGSGDAATAPCSQVTVSYTGMLLDSTIVDSTAAGETTTFDLGQVIAGWQTAIPLISTGGEIMVYISPSLGYGSQVIRDSQGNVVIPANSDLIFDIKVVAIKNPQ